MTTHSKLATPLPEHGDCFICGTNNPNGLSIVWYKTPQDDGSVVITADFEFNNRQQGPPHHAHGGSTAAVLDEAMGCVTWSSGLEVVAASININYHLPVPLYTKMHAEARVERIEGRKAFAKSRLLLPDGRTAVSGSGVFVAAPHLFKNSGFLQFVPEKSQEKAHE